MVPSRSWKPRATTTNRPAPSEFVKPPHYSRSISTLSDVLRVASRLPCPQLGCCGGIRRLIIDDDLHFPACALGSLALAAFARSSLEGAPLLQVTHVSWTDRGRQVAALSCYLVFAIISSVPGELRPQVPGFSDKLEHFVAFFTLGAVTALTSYGPFLDGALSRSLWLMPLSSKRDSSSFPVV